MRSIININKNWKFIQKNIQIVNCKKEKFKKVNLPHTWNNLDGQDGGNDYYRGTCWYYKKLDDIKYNKNDVVYLEFEGVNSICDVYLNGNIIAHHEGGFSTFRARIDHLLKEKNELYVKVDNSPNDRVYPQMADFTFFGGIYRNVNLIITNNTHFDLDYYGGTGVTVTPVVEGDVAKVKVQSYVTNYTNEDINVDIFDQEGNVVFSKRQKELVCEFEIKEPHLWNGVKDPYLYRAEVSIVKDNFILDNKEINFGIRSYKIDPQEGFVLNGVPTPLRGVSRHQDRFNMGWAQTRKEHEEDMKLIEMTKNKNVITVINKIELNEGCVLEGIKISAKNNNIDALKTEIKNKVGYSYNYENKPLLTNSRQIGLLESSLKNIENGLKELDKDIPVDLVTIDLSKALLDMEDILGNRSKVNLSEEIFSRFCLGK